MTQWDGRVAPPPTAEGILDDRFYHRDDTQLIKRLLEEPAKCSIIVGLRRFGKTSFLRKIERATNGSNAPGKIDRDKIVYPGFRSFFISAKATGDFQARVDEAVEFSATDAEKALVLIDDLQHIAFAWDGGGGPRMLTAFKSLFNAIEDPSRLRVILCEPTSHWEFLRPPAQEASAGRLRGAKRAGPEILGACGPSIASEPRGSLTPLRHQEVWELLAGAPPGSDDIGRARFNLGRAITNRLHDSFGGNPYFLAYAHKTLADEGNPQAPQDNFSRFLAKTNDVIRRDGADGLTSIYESLSSHERLVIDLLHAVQTRKTRDDHDSADFEDYFPAHDRMSRVWKADAVEVHRQLGSLGLVETDGSWATRIISEPFLQVIQTKYNKKNMSDILENPDEIPKELWSTLLDVQHPVDVKLSKPLIHQFGDLFFDAWDGKEAVASQYWDSYLDWLERSTESERPHFIVICGNILAGNIQLQLDNDGGQKYKTHLESACKIIAKAVALMRPVAQTTNDPTRNQIIIVPGVLDIDWPTSSDASNKLVREYRQKTWDNVIYNFGFSPGRPQIVKSGQDDRYIVLKPILFKTQRIAFIPFDSVGLDSVQDSLGDEAVRNICSIRSQIRDDFRSRWVEFRGQRRANGKGRAESASNPQSDADAWAKFAHESWRYVVQSINDDTPREFDEDIKSNFQWSENVLVKESAADTDRKSSRRVFLSESGFISEEAVKHGLDLLKKEIESDALPGLPILQIAVTHHCPQQRRRGTLVEFFHAFSFRRLLTENNIRWVLHGHSIRPQRMTETVRDRHGITGSNVLELLGPGTFSDMADLCPVNDSELEPGAATFNIIAVTLPPRTDHKDKDIQVHVKFMQWRPNKSEPELIADLGSDAATGVSVSG